MPPMTPFIVMCAPNGARKSQDDHPGLPISPAELADCAEAVRDAGASMLHLHVRDESGAHSLDVDRYRAAINAIERRIGDTLVIQVTSEACGIFTPQEQMAMVRELKPEAVSLALRELCPNEDTLGEAGQFLRETQAAGTLVQHILYSPDDVQRFVKLREQGVIAEENPFALFVLGRYSRDLRGDVDDLDEFVDALRGCAQWSVCCFGASEAEAAARAASAGGHARVGFENNLYLPDGSVAENNAELVALAAAKRGNRPLATADDVRNQFAHQA